MKKPRGPGLIMQADSNCPECCGVGWFPTPVWKADNRALLPIGHKYKEPEEIKELCACVKSFASKT